MNVDITVNDSANKPVAGMTLSISLRTNRLQGDRVVFAGGEPFLVATDENGRVPLSIPVGVGLDVRNLPESEWKVEPWFSGALTSDTSVVLAAVQTININVAVVYEDNVPFTGRFDFRSGSIVGDCAIKGGVGRIKGVNVLEDLDLISSSVRVGYDRQVVTFPAGSLKNDNTYDVVIKWAKDPKGWVEIDFNMLASGEKFRRTLFCIDTNSKRKAGSGTVTSDKIEKIAGVTPGTYVLSITAGGLVWRSEPFRVESGKTTRQTPVFEKSCSVKFEIQDSTGAPLAGAVVRINEGTYADFPAEPKLGSVAVSDSRGIAILSGLAGSVKEIEVDALGFQTMVQYVTLVSGSELNGGVVRLEKATGRVEIRVMNQHQSIAYSVGLVHPHGTTGYGTLRSVPSDGLVVFENVSRRRYSIVIIEQGSGCATSVIVDLAENPTPPTVVLDCNNIKHNASVK